MCIHMYTHTYTYIHTYTHINRYEQGFGCEFQSLGAVLGLADAVGGEDALRQKVHAVSGASSGAKIAALVAAPGNYYLYRKLFFTGAKIAALVAAPVPLERAASFFGQLQCHDIFFVRTDLVNPLAHGGLMRGDALRSTLAQVCVCVCVCVSVYDTLRCTLAQALGTARLRFDACQIPLGVSAFSLSSWSSVSLTEGDVLSALGASGAFPVQILKSQSSIVALSSD